MRLGFGRAVSAHARGARGGCVPPVDVTSGRGPSLAGDALDFWELGLFEEELWGIEEDPSMNPLAELELEFLGLCCSPKRLVRLRSLEEGVITTR